MSTALCFHDVQCLEPTCNDHGECVDGQCTCKFPWIGHACNQLNCSTINCSDHGNCTDGKRLACYYISKVSVVISGKCLCVSGWKGDLCNEGLVMHARWNVIMNLFFFFFLVCPSGTFGPGCSSRCWCYGKSLCDPETGACKCSPGYTGLGCWNGNDLLMKC